MTSINSNTKVKPFLLFPAGKDYLWGGTRLKEEFGKNIDMDPLAETWECSTHPDGSSIVASGEFKNQFLVDVLKNHKEFLGERPNKLGMPNGELPILIKFIDAKKDLSVQVHPDDDYARKYENGQLGKTEMWYVMDADKDAKIIYGFYHDIEKQTLYNSMNDGTLGKYLQKVKIKKDDVFFIEAGTVHAIGAGALIAEIQENSNLTYRLFDYNRKDKNGNLRELHKEKAVAVANLNGSSEPRQPMRLLKYKPGVATELLCRCKYFQVERCLLNTELARQMFPFHTVETTFHILLCLNGCGTIYMEDGDRIDFFKGDCVFVPADSVNIKIHGKAQFLNVSC